MATNNAINANSTTPLPIVDGGTGVNAVTVSPTATSFAGWDTNKNFTSNNSITSYATTVTSGSPVVLVVGSKYQQYFTGSAAQTVTLPVTSTLVLGQSFQVVNNSSAIVTVQSSGSNTITAMAANTQAVFTCILTSGTTAASWNSDYGTEIVGFTSINTQVFTGSGTYTPTTGMLYCDVYVTGGGGGGGGSTGGAGPQASSGGGGGSGSSSIKWGISAATVGASQSVTIGAAGAAGTSGGGTGGTGGVSSFGAIITTTGGLGGVGASSVSSPCQPAAGGAGGAAGSGGSVNMAGAAGYIGIANGVSGTGVGGNGASSYWGGGALGPFPQNDGAAGTAYGSGGSAGASLTNNHAGGVGAAGVVVVVEYI